MLTEDEINRHLYELLTTADECMTEEQLAHREGRIRSLVLVLTGKDVGYACLACSSDVLKALGWKYRKHSGRVTFDAPFASKEEEEEERERGRFNGGMGGAPSS